MHGHACRRGSTAEYRTWMNIKDRCYRKKNPAYPNYGGRGITVCTRWRRSFKAFLRDMGPKPSPQHSIERVDGNGHYEPDNCKWATLTEQANNKRSNVVITARGKTQTVARWARELGIKAPTIYRRIWIGDGPEAALRPTLRSGRWS